MLLPFRVECVYVARTCSLSAPSKRKRRSERGGRKGKGMDGAGWIERQRERDFETLG